MTLLEETSPLLARFIDGLSLDVANQIDAWRQQGFGYKRVYQELQTMGYPASRLQVQEYCAQLERTVMSSIGDAEDNGIEVSEDYFTSRGIELPPEGMKLVAATVEERGSDGAKHWVRLKPAVEAEDERIEIRQAQPVEVKGTRPLLTVLNKGDWQVWAIVPDSQIGYWVDSSGTFHSTHDERCFSLGHQIMQNVADDGGLHGVLDLGDMVDLSCASRWDPTAIDTNVGALNKTWQRVSEELAWRRWLVGDDGEVVVTSGNHDDRLYRSLSKAAPWLIGMQRPGETNRPVLSVPYLVRADDYAVEWCESFPSTYRKLNGNLVAMHAPALGTKPFDTAKRIATMIHASVVHGHSHRSERASFNLETTDKGVRTFTVWSSGCWARIDGSLPSGKNSFDSRGNRLLAGNQPPTMGMLSENFHQGMDIVHVEVGGSERWSQEHIDFWGPFAQHRGKTFEAGCDVEGMPVP